jgi:hypothetical protein
MDLRAEIAPKISSAIFVATHCFQSNINLRNNTLYEHLAPCRDRDGRSFLNRGGFVRRISQTDFLAVAPGFGAAPPVHSMRPSYGCGSSETTPEAQKTIR